MNKAAIRRRKNDRDEPGSIKRAMDAMKDATGIPCPYGRCLELVTPDGVRHGGMGSVTCPCDQTPGWKAKHYDGMGKPRPAVLAKGRHRSRVLRSIARHRS